MYVMFVLSLFPLYLVAFCFCQYNNFFTSLGLKIFCDIIKKISLRFFFFNGYGGKPTYSHNLLEHFFMLLVMYFLYYNKSKCKVSLPKHVLIYLKTYYNTTLLTVHLTTKTVCYFKPFFSLPEINSGIILGDTRWQVLPAPLSLSSSDLHIPPPHSHSVSVYYSEEICWRQATDACWHAAA